MPQEKISFDQFLTAVSSDHSEFVQALHHSLLEQGCKVSFEEKKSGYLASYKYGKPPKAFLNFLFRKDGMHVRIYGEGYHAYGDFLNTLPATLVTQITSAGDCRRLTQNTCSPKCSGYDFMIADAHFQKCRYGCFEFLITEESKPHIKAFIEQELNARLAM